MSAADVDASIAGFPPKVAERLALVREALLRAVPGGDEVIRYGIAAVVLGGRRTRREATPIGWSRSARARRASTRHESTRPPLPPSHPHGRAERARHAVS